jgi:nucleoside-diphosphate-sugar epimerase
MSTTSFVTGGTGFIGSRLVKRLLADGHTVRLLARSPEKARALFDDEVEIIPGDLGDLEALARGCRGADRVFHLAAQVGDFGPRRGYYETNVQGTRAVVDAADRANAGCLVYVSTNAVTGMRRTSVTDESAPYADTGGHYGISKGMAERIIRDRHHQNGFPGVILRPPIVYGPGSVNWVLRPLGLMKQGKMVLIDKGRGFCWHVFVENLVDAALLAASHKKAPGEVFIVGDGKDDTTWGDYFNLLAATAGYGPVTKNVPKRLAVAVAHVSYGLYSAFGIRPKLTPLGVGILTSGAPVSIQKARTVLGYKPKVNLDEGMRRVGEWLKVEAPEYLNSTGGPSR